MLEVDNQAKALNKKGIKMTEGETPQQPAIGPEQFYGLDEPGQDYNRKAPDEDDRSTATHLPESTRIEVSDGDDSTIIGTDIARNVQVDEVTPHISGVNSSEGDSTHINPNSYKIEKDEPTALYMANAGTKQRSIAAKNRAHLRFMDEYAEAIERARGGLFGKHGRQDRIDELSWHDPRFETDDEELMRNKWRIEGAVGNKRSGPMESLAEVREKLREEAHRADEKAERQEAWAKTLHENPPSEAFKQAHPDIKFGAQSLAFIEDWLPYDLELAKGIQSLVDDADPKEVTKANKNWISDWLDSMDYSHAPQHEINEFDNRLRALDDSKESTNGDYDQLYREVVRAYARHSMAKYKERMQVLEDLRSGRSSNPDYKKMAEETSELPGASA